MGEKKASGWEGGTNGELPFGCRQQSVMVGSPALAGDKREVPPAWHKIVPDILGTNPTDLAKPLQNHRGTSGLGDLEAFSQL